MFNLTNLITSVLLASGVASNTTPVCNTRKNANQVFNYTQELEEVNQHGTAYNRANNNLEEIPCTLSTNSDIDNEIVTNYTTTSAFLNVIATKYTTQNIKTIDTHPLTYIQNYAVLEDANIDDYWKETTTNLIIMQIDAYNYNVDTEITINNYIDIVDQNNAATYPYSYSVQYRRFLKQVWRTTDNWSYLLQRQVTTEGAYKVRSEIEDIDNGFFYTKEQIVTDEITLENNEYQYEDITELNLVPNARNYIAIEYIPMAEGTYTDLNTNATWPWNSEQMIAPTRNYNIRTTSLVITGTNVIPDGNYEVIDIPGLMWEILTMPFAFVSQAFNLTLFPGTPYQLNISNLFLSILAVITFIWLIKFIIKLKG